MLMFSVNGQEDSRMAIEFDFIQKPPFLPKEGEYTCGNFGEGNVVYFRNDGITLITGDVILGAEDGTEQPIARLGDSVLVAGVGGTITSASTKHKAT